MLSAVSNVTSPRVNFGENVDFGRPGAYDQSKQAQATDTVEIQGKEGKKKSSFGKKLLKTAIGVVVAAAVLVGLKRFGAVKILEESERENAGFIKKMGDKLAKASEWIENKVPFFFKDTKKVVKERNLTNDVKAAEKAVEDAQKAIDTAKAEGKTAEEIKKLEDALKEKTKDKEAADKALKDFKNPTTETPATGGEGAKTPAGDGEPKPETPAGGSEAPAGEGAETPAQEPKA